MYKDLLPIGSVVALQGASRKLLTQKKKRRKWFMKC